MRERVRQTESGRVAWKKCWFGGGSLFFRKGCRRKGELCGGWGVPVSQGGEGRGAGGLGPASQSWVLGVTRRGMLCSGYPGLPGYQCLPPPSPAADPAGPGLVLLCWLLLHWEKRHAGSGTFEGSSEMGFKASSSAVVCSAMLSKSGNNPQLSKK